MTRTFRPPVAAATGLLALLAPVVLAPAAAHAESDPAPGRAAPGCTPRVPDSDFYAGGRVASEMLTVPADPACTTIAVSHVVDVDQPADRCQDFLIAFFLPSGGDPVYTELVTACSTWPRSRVVLATDVPDGMRYRVLYQIDYLEQDVRFVVWH